MLLTREQLQERLIALHTASLELVKDVSLDRLLERIAAVACEQADARYAALGVLDESGKLERLVRLVPALMTWFIAAGLLSTASSRTMPEKRAFIIPPSPNLPLRRSTDNGAPDSMLL